MVVNYKKRDFPVEKSRQILEPGPVVMVSSYYKGETDIMTMGWHTVLEFSPSLIGCMITSANHSYELIRKSGECVINIPTYSMIDKIVGIGNCSGKDTDKFKEFSLTKANASKINAPLIKECYANLECKIHDRRMLRTYNFFIFEVVKAHIAIAPKSPKTVHYRGDGTFMISGKDIRHKRGFLPDRL